MTSNPAVEMAILAGVLGFFLGSGAMCVAMSIFLPGMLMRKGYRLTRKAEERGKESNLSPSQLPAAIPAEEKQLLIEQQKIMENRLAELQKAIDPQASTRNYFYYSNRCGTC